ncbi:MAG: 50S ribosomal protein L3 [Clostridia bacterium]|nr:50S ribosomal protein L3 [Clostridia bacterium]
MKKAIVGRKVGMTQVFAPDGRLLPVTVVQAGPCTVVQKKTVQTDGYQAIQVGFDQIPEHRTEKLVNKPLGGHFKKAGVAPMRKLREFRFENADEYEIGQVIRADVFNEGEKVDVTGISKGHGTTGSIQRWGQRTGPKTHGSKYHRGIGALSANSYPGKVFKGRHMPGHYGVERITIQSLSVVRVDAERDLLLIRGAIPGPNGGIVVVRDAVKA